MRNQVSSVEKRTAIAVRNKLPFISGTISPPPIYKCEGNNGEMFTELENLESAIKYYREKGFNDLIIQHKHMGSRATVLFSEKEDKVFTRNGIELLAANKRRIEKITLKQGKDAAKPVIAFDEKLRAELGKLRNKVFSLKPTLTEITLDCELMPWSALGRSLVDNKFNALILQHAGECGTVEFIAKKIDKDTVSKKHAKFLDDYVKKDTNMGEFRKQVELYGLDGDVKLNVFDVLSFVDSGVKHLTVGDMGNLLDNYPFARALLEDTPWERYDFENVDFSNFDVSKLAIYKTLVEDQAEGFIVRPASYSLIIRMAPCLKVRNKEYLRLVYGPSYLEEEAFEELLLSKNVTGKIAASRAQWTLGFSLLALNEEEREGTSEHYTDIIKAAMEEIERAETLDARL